LEHPLQPIGARCTVPLHNPENRGYAMSKNLDISVVVQFEISNSESD